MGYSSRSNREASLGSDGSRRGRATPHGAENLKSSRLITASSFGNLDKPEYREVSNRESHGRHKLHCYSSRCCPNVDSYVAGSTNSSVRGEVGLRRSSGLAGVHDPCVRDDPQPEHHQGHEESLPDRELWLSRARVHEPHSVRLLGALSFVVDGGLGRFLVERGHLVGVWLRKYMSCVPLCVCLLVCWSSEGGIYENTAVSVWVCSGCSRPINLE